MKNKIFCCLALLSTLSFACMTGGKKSLSKAELIKKFTKTRNPAASDIAPFANGHASPSAESRLGNLLLEYQKKGQRFTLSIPAKIERSQYHPFGDGQSNAKLTFGSWKGEELPVLGVQTETNGRLVRNYIFNKSLKVAKFKESEIAPKLFKVQPEGWENSFYFSFETGTLSVAKLVSGIPEKLRNFGNNRLAPDISKVGKGPGVERIVNRDLGEGFNKDAWFNDNVHGRFPEANGIKTALGGVFTKGIVDKKFGPFKYLYTCFEPRDLNGEKDSGIPSGAGWHHIGDAAETLLNTLESESIPVAIARSHQQAKVAYDLTESVVATWLSTDEALVTKNGEFHWYLNPYEAPVCTEIWVHNCIPSPTNNWGFQCNG